MDQVYSWFFLSRSVSGALIVEKFWLFLVVSQQIGQRGSDSRKVLAKPAIVPRHSKEPHELSLIRWYRILHDC